jgi:hypothetical protein
MSPIFPSVGRLIGQRRLSGRVPVRLRPGGRHALVAHRIERPIPTGGNERVRLPPGAHLAPVPQRLVDPTLIGRAWVPVPPGALAGRSTGRARRPHKPRQLGSTPSPAPVPIAQRKSTASTTRRPLDQHQLGARMARSATGGPRGFTLEKRVRLSHALPFPRRLTVWHRPVKPTTKVTAGSNPAEGAMHRSPPGRWGLPYKQDAAGFDSRAVHSARVAQRESTCSTHKGPAVRNRPRVRTQHMVAVAHLVERRVVTAEETGSIPVSHPKGARRRRRVGPGCNPGASA